MKLFSIVSKNGQITIPKKIRQDYGLNEGTIIRFIKDTNKITLQKINIKKAQ